MDCPRCSAEISSVYAEPITVNATTGSWRGLGYACPSCAAVLTVGPDPISLKNDFVQEVLKRLCKD